MKEKMGRRLLAYAMAFLMAFSVIVQGDFTLHMSHVQADELIDISTYTVTKPSNQTYTGSALTPNVYVYVTGTTKLSSDCYTVSYSNNIDAGTATATVTGVESMGYTGTVTKNFTITAKKFSKSELSVTLNGTGAASSGTDAYYYRSVNGGSTAVIVEPSPTVVCDGVTLTEGVDYDVTYPSENVTIVTPSTATSASDGKPYALITAKGNYSGTYKKAYTIVEANISDQIISLEYETTEADGTAKKPSVTVKSALTVYNLVEGKDYEVSYSNNTAVGTATVTITGLNGYTGTATKEFEIVSAGSVRTSISNATVSVADCSYTGSNLYPDVTVTLNGTELVKGTDYTVAYSNNMLVSSTNPTVTITGKGNYKDSVKKTFTISPKDIGEVTFTSVGTATYNYGSAVTASVTVKDADRGVILTANTDYTVSYSNNTKAGTGTLTITGTGNYTGTKSTEFTINQIDASGFKVTIEDQKYTGSAIQPAATITNNDGSYTLVAGTDYTLSYGENIEPDSGTVTVNYKGNFKGSATATFNIVSDKVSITKTDVTLDKTSYTFTGSQIKPVPVVTYNNTTLVEGTDYSVSYGENTYVSTGGTVTITGKNGYTGTQTVSFTISKVSVSSDSPVVSASYNAAPEYQNGEEVKPAITLTYNNYTLVQDKDYTVLYSAYSGSSLTGYNSECFICIMWKSGNSSNFSGDILYYDYTIVGSDVDLDDVAISAISPQEYSRTAIEPELTLTYGGVTLVKGTDYNVTFTNNTEVGTATATITAVDGSSFVGSRSVNFTITKRNISSFLINLTETGYEYTGEAILPEISSMTFNGYTISSDLDDMSDFALVANDGEDCIDAGTYAFTVEVINEDSNYTGSTSDSFTITPFVYNSSNITMEVADQVYSGSPLTPAVTLKYNDEEIPSDRYTLEYVSNTNAGTAGVFADFTGNYSGSVTGHFTISRKSIEKMTVSNISSQIYTGEAITPEVTVTDGTKALVLNNDYTVTYSNNTNISKAGSLAKATVTGIQNYTGTVEITFAIVADVTDLSDGGSIADIADVTYTGSSIEPEITVTYGGNTLTPGTDYSVQYTNNTDAGTAKVIVTGAGDYTGVIEGSFNILQADFADVTVSLSKDSYTYDGSQCKPGVTVTDSTRKLTVSSDNYTVTYQDNVNAGAAATVVVTPKNNYTGKAVSKTFTIEAKSLENCTVEDIDDVVYTGEEFEPEVVVYDGKVKLSLGTDYTVSYASNKEVGTAVVTIAGKGNYKDTIQKSFAITSKPAVNLKNVTVADITAYTYDGTAKTPLPVVTYGDDTLVKDTDYTLSYSNNTDAGTATVIITAVADSGYTGEIEQTFTINKLDISDAEVVLENAEYTFTGLEIKPSVDSIKLESPEFEFAGSDSAFNTNFEVSYEDNELVGTATVQVSAKAASKNFTGTATGQFEIVQSDLSDAQVTVEDATYTGEALTPQVTVTLNGTELAEGMDYIVEEIECINAGSYQISVSGTDGYTGEASGTFTILPKNISTCTFEEISTQVYTGKEITPLVTVSNGTTKLIKDTDYTLSYQNNTNETTDTSKASVIITAVADGNYTGSKTLSFDIEKIRVDLKNATIENVDAAVYCGKAVTPTLTVSYGGTVLVENTDYTVSYKNNLNAGTATATITAVADGNYTGSNSINFTISKLDISSYTADIDDSDKVYTGSAIKPALEDIVDYETGIKISDLDGLDEFNITYSNNTNVGTATYEIAAKTSSTNYTGSIKGSFNITAAALTGAKVEVAAGSYVYSGTAITPAVTVTLNGTVLSKDKDYTVSYESNTDAGTAAVTVTGTGNYAGQASGSFTISQADISEATAAAIGSQTYTGEAITPEPVLTYGGTSLKKGTDYTLKYGENTAVGTGEITVSGTGNYTGTLELSFDIAAADISKAVVSGVSDAEYTGSRIVFDGLSVALNSKVLSAGTDYVVEYSDNTDVGKATITITGKGNYTGSKKVTFNISGKDISDAAVGGVKDTEYTGSSITFSRITVSLGGSTLEENQDYTVSYENNTDVTDEAKVVITGTGNYSGSVEAVFAITKKDINNCHVSDIEGQLWNNGEAVEPEVTVTNGDITLVKDKDYTVSYENNKNVTKGGEPAKAVVTGIGNYTGTVEIEFTISKAIVSIETAQVSAIADQTYDGNPKTPEFTVSIGGEKLTLGTDYTVKYLNNTDAGTASVIITGMEDYNGSKTVTFEINPRDITGYTVVLGAFDKTYTGNEIKAVVSEIKDTASDYVVDMTGDEAADFTVESANNINAGTATVTVTASGNYKGNTSVTYTIAAKSLANAQITAGASVYTGQEVSPSDLTVTLDGITLVKGTDYEASYSNNVNAGEAKLTITGKGNYTGTAADTFTITPKKIDTCDVSDVAAQSYTGSEIKPELVVSDGATVLTENKDYELSYTGNINATKGNEYAVITVTGTGNYTGSLDVKFQISALSLEDAVISGVTDSYYTGSEITFAGITVKLGDTLLTLDEDYTVSYIDNVNAGTGIVVVTGTGNYTGRVSTEFVIRKYITDCQISQIPGQIFTGNPVTPQVVVKDGEQELSEGVDYKVSYENNTAVTSEAVAIIEGMGKYEGTAQVTFSISKDVVSIEDAVISDAGEYVYTGSEIKPVFTVSYEGTELELDTDYTISYENNINAGTATATITGKGDYTGAVTKEYVIAQKSIANASITADDQTFTGEALKPEVTVSLEASVLNEGTDYTVSYSNNTDAGEAKIVVIGKGNYTGRAEGSFEIAKKNIQDCTVSDIEGQEWTGSKIEPEVVITYGDITLVKDTDYTVVYAENINETKANEATATITGKGNYEGSVVKSFTITKGVQSIAGAVISSVADVTYSGTAYTPDVTVTLNGEVLSKDTDYTVAYADNINAGTATITVTGTGSYKGQVQTTFKINKKSIDNMQLTLGEYDKVYSGKAVTPEVISLGDGEITDLTGFTVVYQSNVDAGTATVKVTAAADNVNYTGSTESSFEIASMDIKAAVITAIDKPYTGSKVTTSVQVTLDGNTLAEGRDYDIAYDNNISVGTAKVTITGKGNYQGTATGSFNITAIDISDFQVTGITDMEYTGSSVIPSITVKNGTDKLVEATDYEVSIQGDTVNVGAVVITITGKGNYTGTITKSYNITAADIKEAVVTGYKDSPYTGKEITFDLAVSLSGKELEADKDYQVSYKANVNVGTATIVITGTGNYTGTVEAEFAITRVSISSAEVTGLSADTYTGKAIVKTDMTVTLDGKKLSEDVDYQVAYSNNVNAGTAIVTITGIGTYDGSLKKEFTIEPADISACTISDIAGQKYTGNPIKPSVTVSFNGSALAENTDYELTYLNNTDVTTDTQMAEVIITGKNNFTGKQTVTFTIAENIQDIGDGTFEFAINNLSDKVYSGSPVYCDSYSLKDSKGNSLSESSDYKVSYINNVNAGTATVTATGCGKYTGTITATFEINPFEINSSNTVINLKNDSYPYTGKEIQAGIRTLVITTGSGDITITDLSDFDITYSDNVDAGTATITVTPKSGTNFTGSVSGTFAIAGKSISGAVVVAEDVTYTGDSLSPAVKVTLDGQVLPESAYTVSYSNNTAAGTGVVTVKGKGNYQGTVSGTFKINPKSIAESTITVENAVCTGSEVTPKVTVKDGSRILTSGTDYDVVYSNNINPTTESEKAQVLVTGKGNYEGVLNGTFDITLSDISEALVTGISDTTYNRSAVVFDDMKVTLDGVVLTKGTDYTVTYSNNINAGTATVTITGTGIYTGTIEKSFNIARWDVSDIAVISDINDVTYTGEKLTPDIKVTVNGKILTAGVDYTVTYSSNINVGTAAATVTFAGNYTGSTDGSFEIIPLNLSECTLDSIGSQIYTGQAIKPAVTLRNGDIVLAEGTDYEAPVYSNNIQVTTTGNMAQVTITGKGNYTGTISGEFAITKEIVNLSKVTLDKIADETYTGSSIEPELNLIYGDYTLVAGQDYDAVYSNNVNAGTAKVVITGKGSFTGSINTTFVINKLDITDFTVEYDETDHIYSGEAVTPAVTALTDKASGITISEDVIKSSFTVKWLNNIEVGNASITVTANTGTNYTGTATAGFAITAASFADAVVKVNDTDLTYTGDKVTPEVTVSIGKKVLSSDDYDVEYTNNVNAGTAKIIVIGKGSYDGTVTTEFTIAKKSLADCSVSDIPAAVYTGTAIKPTVTVSNGSIVLSEGTDYTVAYENNINAGTDDNSAKVIITATSNSNYTGTREIDFSITAASIKTASVTGISDSAYTGKEITFDNISVLLSGATLVSGQDYEISYKNNVNAGTAKVVITGKNNYTGSIETEFTIAPTDISSASVDGITSQVEYKGSAYTFDGITVTLDGKKLTKDTDYKVTYENNVNIGTATVVITGKNNYAGTITKSFEIESISISGGKATAPDQEYTGAALTPEVTVTVNGNKLQSTDYTVVYENNTEVGTAKITVTGQGNCGGTIEGTFNILPAAVTGLTFVTATVNSIKLSWDKVAGAEGYKVYSYNSSTKKYTLLDTVTENEITVSESAAATDYAFAVSAVATTADGTALEGAKADIVANTAPNAVTGLKCTSKTDTTVNLSWNKVTGATGYRIFRYDPATKSYKVLKTVVATTLKYSDTGLKAGTAYRYVVRSFTNRNGKVLWGAMTAINLGTRPSSVTGLKVSVRGTNSLKLTWNRNTTASGYMIYRYNPTTKKYTRIKVITSNATTSFISTGLASGTSYIYRVYTYKTFAGVNVVGAGVSIKNTTKPSTPVAAAAGSSGKAVVAWKSVTGAIGYEVYMSTSYNGTYTRIGTVSSSTLKITKSGLVKGRTYYFKVRAFRALNGVKIYSDYSTIKSAVIK